MGVRQVRRILYVGNDKGFWSNIKHRFQTNYQHLELDFKEVSDYSDDNINQIVHDTLEYSPNFIYIDLSSNLNVLLKLGLYLKRLKVFSHVAVSALVEDEKSIEESLYTGFDFAFIKGAELHDIIYHPYYFFNSEEALKKDFALAKTQKETKMVENFRIGFYSNEYFHAESNNSWSIGDEVRLSVSLSNEFNKCDTFTVINKSTSGMYYNYKYNYDFQYKFLPDLPPDDELREEVMQIADDVLRQKAYQKMQTERKNAENEHEGKKEHLKKSMKKWVESFSSSMEKKSTKILIVDETLNFLKNENRKLDSFPYTVRLQTSFSKDFSQVEQYLPQLIVFSIPEVDFGEAEETLEEEEKIAMIKKAEVKLTDFFNNLIKTVKSLDNYVPFIIVFNCMSSSSKAFQDTYRYDLIITNQGKLDFNLVLQMAELFEKKQQSTYDAQIENKIQELRKEDPKKYGRLTKQDFIESKYFVSKNNKLSRGSFSHNVTIKAISESEVFLLINKDLELTSYFIQDPFKMAVRLVPHKGKKALSEGDSFLYKGLIHAIGEREKKRLRQYVNEIYTAHKAALEAQEKAEFLKMNQKADELESDEANEDQPNDQKDPKES